ncbi:hypothetical protein Tco_0496725 [Tanacetum coccineum]
MDTAYGSSQIRRIGNWSNAFSCEVQPLIRRISLVGCGVLQSLVDVGSENRPPMLEKESYVPWSTRFMWYIDGKKETRKLIKDSIVNGPYVMKEIYDSTSTTENHVKKLQTVDDLTGDEKKQYDADIDAMNLILLGIPNDIYNSMDECNDA